MSGRATAVPLASDAMLPASARLTASLSGLGLSRMKECATDMVGIFSFFDRGIFFLKQRHVGLERRSRSLSNVEIGAADVGERGCWRWNWAVGICFFVERQSAGGLEREE
jgi:hypothetical protein